MRVRRNAETIGFLLKNAKFMSKIENRIVPSFCGGSLMIKELSAGASQMKKDANKRTSLSAKPYYNFKSSTGTPAFSVEYSEDGSEMLSVGDQLIRSKEADRDLMRQLKEQLLETIESSNDEIRGLLSNIDEMNDDLKALQL